MIISKWLLIRGLPTFCIISRAPSGDPQPSTRSLYRAIPQLQHSLPSATSAPTQGHPLTWPRPHSGTQRPPPIQPHPSPNGPFSTVAVPSLAPSHPSATRLSDPSGATASAIAVAPSSSSWLRLPGSLAQSAWRHACSIDRIDEPISGQP